MNKMQIILNGILKNNPTFVLVLGMCPTLGTTTSAINGMGMGLATTFVLILSNMVISGIAPLIPSKVKIPSYIVVIAALVTILQFVMQAYVPALYETLGLFIPLIVVNCIVLGRAEAYACKNSILDSALDGIGIGLAIAALTLLVVFAGMKGDAWAVVSCAIFGVTMITLYFGSTMCHATIGKKSECFFEVWDSVAIYALIAGTYTPFLLVNLRGPIGWTVFGILWAIVLFGAYMKIKSPKQQPKWMVALYLVMGWTLLFILPAMIRAIPIRGLWLKSTSSGCIGRICIRR